MKLAIALLFFIAPAPALVTEGSPSPEGSLFDLALYLVEVDYRTHLLEEEAYREKHSIIPSRYRDMIMEENRDLNIPPEIIYWLIYHESRWTPHAVGHNPNGTRDKGLMQLNNRYTPQFVDLFFQEDEPFDVFNPQHNAQVGMGLLASLHDHFGKWDQAIMAYNAGRGAVQLGRIPASTKLYVTRILGGTHT